MIDFVFLGSKITGGGDCSYEIKRCLLLRRKVMTNLDSILETRDITLPTKVHILKAMVFPVVMYGCGSCTIKKAECWRIDAFELWCWRRLLIVSWTARRSNQSFLKEISPEHSFKEWCWNWSSDIWPPDVKNWLIKKGPDAGKDWRQRKKGMTGWDGWMASPTWWTSESEQTLGVGNWQTSLVCCSPWGLKESDMTEGLNWAELIVFLS